MNFTEYQFDREQIKNLGRARRRNLKENRGLSDFPGFALSIFAGRLQKDPKRYRDYGPY